MHLNIETGARPSTQRLVVRRRSSTGASPGARDERKRAKATLAGPIEGWESGDRSIWRHFLDAFWRSGQLAWYSSHWEKRKRQCRANNAVESRAERQDKPRLIP